MVRVRVKGIDSETNEPIPFARVEFWRPGDKRPFKVSSTDEEGVAEVDVPEGKYTVLFKSQLHKPVRHEVEITEPLELTIKSFKIVVGG